METVKPDDVLVMPHVKVSVAEEALYGDLAKIVRKVGEAALALADARQIANVFLNETWRMDGMWTQEERVPVVTDRSMAFDDDIRPAHGGPAWVETYDGKNDKGEQVCSPTVVSEAAAFLGELFETLWDLEGPVAQAHRSIALEAAQRCDRERRSTDSRPAARVE